MGKRDNKTITIGSALPYCIPYTDTVPTVEDICKEENLLGYIKGGAALEYAEETYEERTTWATSPRSSPPARRPC
jgi:hypothetical protein